MILDRNRFSHRPDYILRCSLYWLPITRCYIISICFLHHKAIGQCITNIYDATFFSYITEFFFQDQNYRMAIRASQKKRRSLEIFPILEPNTLLYRVSEKNQPLWLPLSCPQLWNDEGSLRSSIRLASSGFFPSCFIFFVLVSSLSYSGMFLISLTNMWTFLFSAPPSSYFSHEASGKLLLPYTFIHGLPHLVWLSGSSPSAFFLLSYYCVSFLSIYAYFQPSSQASAQLPLLFTSVKFHFHSLSYKFFLNQFFNGLKCDRCYRYGIL